MNPFRSVARRLTRTLASLGWISPLAAARILYRIKLGRWPDVNDPKDLNEKILRLEFFTDTSMWTRLADKFEVRGFVRERGLENILVPLYGIWNEAGEIDFDTLPDRFALKSTNGYAQILLISDKARENTETIRRKAAKWANKTFGKAGAEPHYARIPARVMAEKLLSPSSQPSSVSSSELSSKPHTVSSSEPPSPAPMLVDYKFLCFGGKPLYCLVCSRRDPKTFHPLLSIYSIPEWKKIDVIMPRDAEPDPVAPPPSLLEMMDCAATLSKGFPFVRVDLYDIDGKVMFGEMTFTPAAARIDYFTPDFLLHLGSLISIPR